MSLSNKPKDVGQHCDICNIFKESFSWCSTWSQSSMHLLEMVCLYSGRVIKQPGLHTSVAVNDTRRAEQLLLPELSGNSRRMRSFWRGLILGPAQFHDNSWLTSALCSFLCHRLRTPERTDTFIYKACKCQNVKSVRSSEKMTQKVYLKKDVLCFSHSSLTWTSQECCGCLPQKMPSLWEHRST